MSKIYFADEPRQGFLYSESYNVIFWFKNEDGYYRKGQVIAWAASKNAHKKIEAAFKQRFPKAAIESIRYQ